MMRRTLFLASFYLLSIVHFAYADTIIKNVVIKADRDIGYFVGDLVAATVEVTIPDGWQLQKSSLPHEGAIDYWLDLKTLDVKEAKIGDERLIAINLLYQDFYDALDVRNQEIPSFPLYFSKGDRVERADVPSWTISVSPLREIAPPPQSDPKDYMRPDTASSFIHFGMIFRIASLFAIFSALSVLAICYRLAWWPFVRRANRPFLNALKSIHRLHKTGEHSETYLQSLLILHRGFDTFVGRRLLAEDLPRFLEEHPQFQSAREHLTRFFQASREAFFKSRPDDAERDMSLAFIVSFAAEMASIERRG